MENCLTDNVNVTGSCTVTGHRVTRFLQKTWKCLNSTAVIKFTQNQGNVLKHQGIIAVEENCLLLMSHFELHISNTKMFDHLRLTNVLVACMLQTFCLLKFHKCCANAC